MAMAMTAAGIMEGMGCTGGREGSRRWSDDGLATQTAALTSRLLREEMRTLDAVSASKPLSPGNPILAPNESRGNRCATRG